MIDINNNNHDNSNRCGRHRHRYRYRHRYRHRPLHLHSAQFLIKVSDFVTWRTSFPKLALRTQVSMWVMRRTLQNGRTPRTCGAQKMHVFAIVCFLRVIDLSPFSWTESPLQAYSEPCLPCDSGDVCLCRPSSRVCTRSSAYSTHVFGCTYLHPDLTVFQQQVLWVDKSITQRTSEELLWAWSRAAMLRWENGCLMKDHRKQG